MKIFIIPILKVLLMLWLITLNFGLFTIAYILYALWNFEIMEWKDWFNNEGETCTIMNGVTIDLKPEDTLKRWWRLDFI